ncbi:hypothetical protein ABT112_16485 [Streptomyces sp. NPDC002055]|uniref:DUF7660 family protein n=1 Tax=Streptomyces sp. NPDC002055 TaxID=3154534 RepID=UPI003319459E
MSAWTADASSVRSREGLFRYLLELASKVEAGEYLLENVSAVNFVKAAAHWVNDMDGFFLNNGEEVPEDPEWETIAMIFSAACIYE